MRLISTSIFLILSFCVASIAHAYYDDSVIIEIGGASPPEVEVPAHAGETTPASNSGSGSTGNNTSNTSNGGGSPSGTGSGNTTSNGSTSGTGAPGSTSGSRSTSTSASTSVENTILSVLTNEGGIHSEAGGVQNTSSSSDTAQNARGGNTPDAASNTGTGTITLNAEKIRATVRRNTSFESILGNVRSSIQTGAGGGGFTQSEMSLLGASAILDDARIDQIIFGATRFEIVYQSRGYLMGFIPKKFSVRVTIDPQATFMKDRVVLTLPWYSFLLRKLFSPSDLSSEINTILTNAEQTTEDAASDVQARLFDAVATLLNKKIGTVGETVREE